MSQLIDKQGYFDIRNVNNTKYTFVLGARSMNIVFLSGKLIGIQEYEKNVKIGQIEDKDNNYIICWENNNFINDEIIGKNVSVLANVVVLKIKNAKGKITFVNGYKVKEMEIINDI